MLKRFKHWFVKPEASTLSVREVLGDVLYNERLIEAHTQMRRNGTTPPVPLTDDDLVVLYLYTHQHLSGYHYKSINSVLRGKYHPLAANILVIANALTAALNKLPAYSGWTARMVWFGFFARWQHRPGNVVTYAAFTSSTSLSRSPLKGDTHKMLYSKSGRDISWVSRFPNEQEILYPPRAAFSVLRVTQVGPILEMVMEEV